MNNKDDERSDAAMPKALNFGGYNLVVLRLNKAMPSMSTVELGNALRMNKGMPECELVNALRANNGDGK
jgi:hypothetical protein